MASNVWETIFKVTATALLSVITLLAANIKTSNEELSKRVQMIEKIIVTRDELEVVKSQIRANENRILFLEIKLDQRTQKK